jgi:DNA excision repair protein ERCC-1
MTKPISNPYAKRPSSSATSSAVTAPATRDSSNDTTTSFGLDAGTFSAGTFSQAFPAAVDDTPVAVQHETNQGQPSSLQSSSLLSNRDLQQWLPSNGIHLLVSNKQRGNGVLPFIRNVPLQESACLIPDYILGSTRCALFLSCKYHSLHPQYIHKRIAELKHDFTLRVLLVLVDEVDPVNALLYLNKLAVVQSMTLILAWSEQEAARYLETFKAMDGKDASTIQKKKAESQQFGDQVADFLSKGAVNKTDAAQLLGQFANVRSVAAASVDELATVSGMGQVKVKRLYDALHKPFSSRAAKKRRKLKLEKEDVKLPPVCEEEGDDDDDVQEKVKKNWTEKPAVEDGEGGNDCQSFE